MYLWENTKHVRAKQSYIMWENDEEFQVFANV